jgi:two-component system, LytTR family, response regulator
MLYKAAIIDNDVSYRHTLVQWITHHIHKLEIVFEGPANAEAKEYLTQLHPNIILYSIGSNSGNDFTNIPETNVYDQCIIFISDSGEFVLESLRYNPVDFLIQPLTVMQLKQAFQKAIQKLNTLALSDLSKKHSTVKITLKTLEKVYVIDSSEIIHCEADGNYTHIYLTKNRKILVSKTLKTYVEKLKDYGFMHLHQSHLINIDYFECYDKRDGGTIIMTDGTKVPISFRKKAHLLKLLNNLY